MISFLLTVWITGVILLALLCANTVARHHGWEGFAESMGITENFIKKFIVIFVLAWPVMLLIMLTTPKS